MRFVFNGSEWIDPSEGIITHLIKEEVKEVMLQKVSEWCSWFVTTGTPILAEVCLVWGMACLMVSITGSGKWLERGCKSVLLSLMLGMVRYAT